MLLLDSNPAVGIGHSRRLVLVGAVTSWEVLAVLLTLTAVENSQAEACIHARTPGIQCLISTGSTCKVSLMPYSLSAAQCAAQCTAHCMLLQMPGCSTQTYFPWSAAQHIALLALPAAASAANTLGPFCLPCLLLPWQPEALASLCSPCPQLPHPDWESNDGSARTRRKTMLACTPSQGGRQQHCR